MRQRLPAPLSLCAPASQVVAASFVRLLPEHAVGAEVAGHGFE